MLGRMLVGKMRFSFYVETILYLVRVFSEQNLQRNVGDDTGEAKTTNDPESHEILRCIVRRE